MKFTQYLIYCCAFLLAQTQNYIEADGKRIYVNSMTEQEVREYEAKSKKSAPNPIIEYRDHDPQNKAESSPPAPVPIIIRLEQDHPRNYGETIKVKIKNKRPVDKEYYETTGRGTFKMVEVDKGKTTEESWKMKGGSLIKERNKQ